MRLSLPCFGAAERPRGAAGQGDDDDDVEAIIFRNVWKNHRLLPPTSKYKSYWDLVRSLPRCVRRQPIEWSVASIEGCCLAVLPRGRRRLPCLLSTTTLPPRGLLRATAPLQRWPRGGHPTHYSSAPPASSHN